MRFGIIGASAFAHVHAQAAANSGSSIVAVHDLDAARARNLAQKAGARVEPSLSGLLAGDDLDAIVVASPSWLHVEHALAAVEAGKHVLVDKPPALQIDQIEELITARDHAQRQVGVVLQRRLEDSVTALIEHRRDLGALTSFDLHNVVRRDRSYWTNPAWRSNPARGGGNIMNHGFHGVDLLAWLFGLPGSVQARSRGARGGPQDETVVGLLDYPSGHYGTFTCSSAGSDELPLELHCYGRTGTLRLVEERLLTGRTCDEIASGSSAYEALTSLYLDFQYAVATGSSPVATLESTRDSLVLAGAILDSSAREGACVNLTPTQGQLVLEA